MSQQRTQPWAARTLQKLRLALATLNVPSEVHEHVREAFKVLGTRQEEALRQVEASCLVDARYRQQSLRAELQGVRAELAGEDPAAALEPARRSQMIVDELGERPDPTSAPDRDTATSEPAAGRRRNVTAECGGRAGSDPGWLRRHSHGVPCFRRVQRANVDIAIRSEGLGHFFTHSTASSMDFTSHREKPATTSFVSANGPSITVRFSRIRLASVAGGKSTGSSRRE